MTQLLTVNKSSHFIIGWVTGLLQNAGLQVSATFSLRSALPAGTACSCAHDINECDCNMEVLLVYGADPLPATLVAHSHNGRTWLSLVHNPESQSSPELVQLIQSALTTLIMNEETAVTCW